MSDPTQTTNVTLPELPPIPRDIIREIAMDIGKEVAAHIETMYPKAIEATTPSMLISVRNCVFNQIMAALETVDEDAIRDRLAWRKEFRRKIRSVYRKMRETAYAG